MPQDGEADLSLLLRNLNPVKAGEWAFVFVRSLEDLDLQAALMTFQESEGLTAIVDAKHAVGLDVRFVGTRIDLRVHSSLSAVGLTSAVCACLTRVGIPANVVAANYHDYVFVPSERADEALAELTKLSDPVRIRRATLKDLDRLTPLFDGYRVFYKQASDPEGARQFLEARMRNSESVVFIAEVDGEAAGFAQLFPTFTSVAMARVWFLNDLFVAPSARKLGIGTKLLVAAQEFAKEDGAVRLLLTTAIDNVTAQSVYEAAGWKRVDQFFTYRFDLA